MTLLTVLALVLVLLLVATLIGLRLPKTHAAASRIRLPATPEDVFAIVADVTAHPQWRPGLDRVELGPELNGAPTWYEYCSGDIRVQFQVVVREPPRSLVTRLVGAKLPLQGTWRYDFMADGEGTILTITEGEKIHHPLLRFIARYVLSYHAAMDVFLIALGHRFGIDVSPEHLSLKPASTHSLPPLE